MDLTTADTELEHQHAEDEADITQLQVCAVVELQHQHQEP